MKATSQKLHLFGQLKRITRQWVESHLICKGDTYPAQLLYLELGDMACERITAAITRAEIGNRPVKAILDPYNPIGSTRDVAFTTSMARCRLYFGPENERGGGTM